MTADQVTLAATQYLAGYPAAPSAAVASPGSGEPWIVVASATAVPRGFYRRFAEHAQARGVNVLTVDYRGIGGSAPRSLRGYAPDYADWGRQDLAAAVAWAAARGPVFLVGHSYGGHAIGLLPDPSLLRAAYVCGVGAGWHGHVPVPERWRVWALWNLVGPVASRAFGYQPQRLLGIGEDLPISIYRQWKRWCSFPRYFFDDPEAGDLVRGFADVRVPIATCNALDDLWALPASRDAFFSGYAQAPIERFEFTAAELGVAQIGHMGYFRAAVGARLWPQILGWLQGKGLALAPAP